MAASNPGADALDTTSTAATALARETRSLDDRLTILATRMLYVSLTFMLACFYFAFVYLDLINQNGFWKPPSLVQRPPEVFGLIEVGVIIVAGLVYVWAQWGGLYHRDWPTLNLGLWITALLGLCAVGLHIYELVNPGITPAKLPAAIQGTQFSTGYGSVFIGLEGVYTGLLCLTVLVLLGVANRARLGLFKESGVAVEAFGEFFGFMAVFALLNYLALYVVPFFPIA
jgi:heme/copper-type cytochrome/quinol oxidase subunit 3